MATGGGDPWKISGEERAKHDAQFFTLKPVNGFVTGSQARDFFMQSGLTTQILGQIWTLADMNGDGKMDKLEFSVAMHLIKKKLQGYELPKVLPASLKAAPSPVIGSFGMQAGPMAMGQAVVMGIAPAMNPPMGMPLSGSMMPQASLATSTMTTGSVGMPLMANGIGPPTQGMQSMGMGMPPAQPAATASSGWTMPHPSKLKYTQLFNTHDRNKRGFLSGVEARSILMQSGLPQPVLAQIWVLSDVDKDGKLTCEEFCIAMHLSDLARLGRALPPTLPAELMPSKARAGSFSAPSGGIAGGMPAAAAPQADFENQTLFGDLVSEIGTGTVLGDSSFGELSGGNVVAPQQKDAFGDLLGGLGMAQPVPPQMAPSGVPMEEQLPEDIMPATFEDKRKENFDKGQAELERRRALLQEQMKAEENARLEKERREAEKRERIRLEQEARRQEELQRQLEKQKKIEMEREEQRRKMIEQREQARRDLERQRQMEWERQRKEQLMAEKQREYEQLASLKSQNANLKGQLESLDGKKSELVTKISQVRNGVTDLTSNIESMRVQRDTTISEIDHLERECTDLTQKLAQLNGEKEQLQTNLQTKQNTPLSEAHRTVMHSVELKKTNIHKLHRELEQVEQETETKLVDIDNGNVQVKSLQSLVEQLQREIPLLQQKQQDAKVMQQRQEVEKQTRDRQKQEQIKKELEAQRKREEADKTQANLNGGNAKQDNWFDFNSGAASTASAQKSGLDGDAWSSAFSTSAMQPAGGDVWGSSDPFANKPAGDSSIKKTQYRALFAFESRSEDELNINPGDTIWVWDVPSEPGMEEWLKGECNGAVGWFPQTYAEIVAETVTSVFPSQQDSSDVFGSAFQPVQTSSHVSPATVTADSSSVKPANPPAAETTFQPTPGEAHKAPDGLRAQALYQWKARQDNHLSFNKDDIIVVKEQEDMWWMGELGDEIGWFPKAYVKLLDGEKASLSSSQTPSPMGTLEKNGANSSPSAEKKDGEFYVAMYSYVSGEQTDLSFNEGDMILVMGKDDDWWTGVLGDKTGIFPASYVKKVEIQTSGSMFSPDAFGQSFSAQFGLGDFNQPDSFGGMAESGMMSTGGSKPVAPPRRSRSKRGSETEASLNEASSWPEPKYDTGSLGSNVAPQAQKKAPPRRSRSKKGSESESSTSMPVIADQNKELGLFDFGADFANAMTSQITSSLPAQSIDEANQVDKALLEAATPGKGTDKAAFGTGQSISFQANFGDAFPPTSEAMMDEDPFKADFPDPFSANTDQAFKKEEESGSNSMFTRDGKNTSSAQQSAGSFFDMDFGNLMSETAPSPVNTNLALEDVKFLKVDSPILATFYIGESTMSASSSAAELSTLTSTNVIDPEKTTGLSDEKVDPFANKSDPFADSADPFADGVDPFADETFSDRKNVFGSDFFAGKADPFPSGIDPFGDGADPFAGGADPFADMFGSSTAASVFSKPQPSPQSTVSENAEVGAALFGYTEAGASLFENAEVEAPEPSELPPPAPPKSYLEEKSGSEEVSPVVPPRTSSLHASDGEPETTAGICDEPGQKSSKKPEIAMVIAPYTATGNGQLSLDPGNLIHVRQKSPRGWWEGELQARGQRKKIGWFPANYVKLLGSSSARSTPDPNATLSATQQTGGGSRASTPQPQPTAPAPSLPPASAERLVALYPYTAQSEDELTFEKDAVITVLSRDNPDWWQGEVNGQRGLFPSNYVTPLAAAQSWLSDSVRHKLTVAEKQRQNYIQELITTEETYNADMSIVLEAFRKPLLEANVLSEQEAQNIFVNWNDLIICNKKFLQSLRVRKKMCGKGKVIFMIGDLLCENLSHMSPYVRFCSCQLSAAALLQRKTENQPEFVEVHKHCVTNPAAKGMPLSSFLLKPMQRITKYPLLIKEILKYTPADHADHGNLEDALQRAEELCSQVNEGVREKENSDRLEWIQRHVQCDGLAESITFNSVTNCLGSRKLVHCGVIYKVKSNKELFAFLFNDFLLLTVPPRVLGPSVASSHIFDMKSRDQFKMYKTPIVLNEVMVKKQSDPESDSCCQFQVSHIERIYHLKAPTESERDLWVKRIETTSRQYLDTERKKRERAHSLKSNPVGRLLVIIEEGIRLRSTTESGKSDPYCEVSMGSQEHHTRVVNNTLNPKWNASMQFTIRDIWQDVLCITVYDRDLYSPNDFLGRTEVRMKEVMEEAKVKKGPITKRLILHEVDTGEVIVKLDLQLYES